MRPRSSSALGPCLALLCISAALAAPKPLAEAAKGVASRIPAGGIVTSELKGDHLSFGAAGTLESAAARPEQIIFEIGSISKVFTGLLLDQEIVAKRLTLDTTLKTLLGGEVAFDDPRIGAITLRQLATHTSGLPRLPLDLFFGADPADPYAKYDRARMFQFLAHAKLSGETPFEMSYSNLGVALIGELIARLHGKSWATLVQERITAPLGMSDTAVDLSDDQKRRLVSGFDGDRKTKSWSFGAFAPAGALHSTAADMITFGKALLHPDTTPFREAIELMFQPQTDDHSIGICIMLAEVDGKRVLEHNGATGGYRRLLQIVPDDGIVRVVLSNNAKVEPLRVINAARGELPRTKPSGRTLTEAQLKEYEGVYRFHKQTSFTIAAHEGVLWSRLAAQDFLALGPHEDADRFFYKIVPAEIRFIRENGKIVSLEQFQGGRVMRAKRTDEKPENLKFPETRR